jgi:peroxiredoxin
MVCPGRTACLALLILTAASVAPSPTHAAAPQARPAHSNSPRLALQSGDAAPDFAIATTPYGWRRFSDFWKASEIVLVFDPDERALVAIERGARELAGNEVSLTVVRRASDGANWDALANLGLSYNLLSDPNGFVAEQFGLTPGASCAEPAWCLVDRDGLVRHLATGVSHESLAAEINGYVRGVREMAEGSEPR